MVRERERGKMKKMWWWDLTRERAKVNNKVFKKFFISEKK
jgi:hypothetical protein